MKSETLPLPDPSFPRILRTVIPPKAAGGTLLSLGLGAVVTLRFGLLPGAVIALLQGTLLFWSGRSPGTLLSLLLLSFALPRFDAFLSPGLHLRMEDLAMAALCFQALYSAGKFRSTTLDSPIALFLASLGLAALCGHLIGTIGSPLLSSLTILKQLSWICGFYAGAWLIRKEEDRERLAKTLLVSTILLALACALFMMVHPYERPFNRAPYLGESNHVGGFAVIALLFFIPRKGIRWKLGAVVALLLLAATGSRTGMMGAAAGLLTLVLAARSRTPALMLGGAVLLLIATPLSRDRLGKFDLEWKIWQKTELRTSEGYSPCWSANRNRFEVWALLMEENRHAPFFGTGPGSRHRIFYESQYMMTLSETGLLGLAAFLFLLWSIARRSRHGAGNSPPSTLAILAAMAVMGLTCNAFFISRLAGPFWILLGATEPENENDRWNS